MAKKKRINNTVSKKTTVDNKVQPSEEEGLHFDVSFEGLYYSVSVSNSNFSNYLRDEKDFLEKFKQVRNIISTLSSRKFEKEILPKFKHCHQVSDKEVGKVKACISEALRCAKSYNCSSVEQTLADTKIYQLGLDKGVRLFGTYLNTKSIFKLYLIDYYHRINYDERRQKVGTKELRFCPMTSEV